ncbi:MAG: ParA family protein [Gammaproteobacteria bacterium]|nr:ParA family protein [Gammaproteobacteria bacterium]
MRVCTFYGFKGGTGRTHALVNVAAQLADKGLNVLVVDFDLEAPGLDSFEFLNSGLNLPGIVDYVQHFLNFDSAPQVGDYIAPTKLNSNIFVMFSGERNPNYAAKMARINWFELYEKRDGFSLFEDMKAQWAIEFEPDYVLIDCSSGYASTVGICTRQLPDTVLAFFSPNAQNLFGLNQIVNHIRSESPTKRRKHIELDFVMTEVPSLYDEEGILEEFRQRFEVQLGIKGLLTIHHYESFQLMRQSVFAVERPNSRLALEYQKLTDLILDDSSRVAKERE